MSLLRHIATLNTSCENELKGGDMKFAFAIISLIFFSACGLTKEQQKAIELGAAAGQYAAENDPSAPTGVAFCPNTGNNLKAQCFQGMKFKCANDSIVVCSSDSPLADNEIKRFRVQFSCAGNDVQLVNNVQPGDVYSCHLGSMTVLGF